MSSSPRPRARHGAVPEAPGIARGDQEDPILPERHLRIAVFRSLDVIGWELRRLRSDVTQPVDDRTTTAAAPDDTQDSLDAIRPDLAQWT
jgi:hypothetical protein